MIISNIVYLSVEEAQHAWEIHIAIELYTRAQSTKETHMLFIPTKRHSFIIALGLALAKAKIESAKIKAKSKGQWSVFRPKTWFMRRTRLIRRMVSRNFN